MEREVVDAITRIEVFDGVRADEVSARRLGGLTNRNYHLESPVGNFVLRLAGEGTSEYIDRQAEAHNARVAAAAGVNAEVLYFDTDDGTMLCRYVENAVTMSEAGFADLSAVARTGQAFRKLHDCGQKFAGRFELFEQIDNYLAHVEKLNAQIPDGYDEVKDEAQAIREALGKHQLPLAPCHCDPLAENFLDTGEKMYIIDFEYAGDNDPMWDLGDASVEAGFNEEQDQIFLQAYFGHEPPAFEVGRTVMYKALCDLLWTLWGVVQVANENPADDFWAYSVNRLERCRTLMGTADFPRHLEAVRRG